MGMQYPIGRRAALVAMAGGLATAARRPAAAAGLPDPGDPELWAALAKEVFGDRPIGDGAAMIAIDAPYRAQDAALVPITLHIMPLAGDAARVRKLTLLIDENPSPLAAVIDLPADAGISRIATTVRVNAYTDMHLVAETEDGGLFMARRFVKAAGGCSAPALNASTEGVTLGTLRFRQFAASAPEGAQAQPEAQIMIRHPNFTGMQMNQLTHLYIPADFVQSLRVWQGDAPLLSLAGGISMSENPQLRFDYRPNGAKMFRAEVTDSSGKVYAGQWPSNPAA